MATPYARMCMGIPEPKEMDKARYERWKKMITPCSSIPPKFNDIKVTNSYSNLITQLSIIIYMCYKLI